MSARVLTWRGHRWLGLAARLYLGWVFVAACLHKIAHPAVFALDTATYDILPLALINPMAIMLPWVELFAGAMLIAGIRVRAAAMMTAGMMVMFIVASIDSGSPELSYWVRIRTPCSCSSISAAS